MWWHAFADPLSRKQSATDTTLPFHIHKKKQKMVKPDSSITTSPASHLLAWIPSLPSMGLTLMTHVIKSAVSSISFRDARRVLSQMEHLSRPFIKGKSYYSDS